MKKLMITTAACLLISTAAVTAQTSKNDAAKGGAVGGAATGAVGGAIVGGPVGAVVGAIVGGAAGATAASLTTPQREYVTTYVEKHPAKNYRVRGDIVIGGRLPPAVTIYEIEGRDDLSAYRYARINGRLVLVKPANREIVYIWR